MAKTSIEWCDHSINPLKARNIETGKVGHFCVKLSAGCKNCYSSRMQKPFLTQLEFVAENRPKVELFFEQKAIDEVLRRKIPTRYFWCDMTDMFWEGYPDEWIDRCFAAMALTPHHTHLVLTKRAARLLEYLSENHGLEARRRVQDVIDPPGSRGVNEDAMRLYDDWPLPNVHLGVSVEDQKTADERIPLLLQTPAAVRFVSYEPALGPVDFGEWLTRTGECIYLDGKPSRGLDWVICGGESGPAARPFKWEWAESVQEQCCAVDTAFFMKQAGSNCWDGEDPWILKDRKGGDMSEWPSLVRVRQFPEAHR